MISNQAASSANMTGNLFQIFNLPKSGNSSYLFSDIIKVIGTESEGETVNNISSAFFTDSSKSLIDSNKLISLLKTNINAGSVPEVNGDDLTGKYFITEAELTEFINKLGLEGTADAAKLTSEIAVEVTPAFLNKLSALVNSSKPQVQKNIFVTIAPEEEKAEEINLSDGEEAEGSEKIQVIFKKVSPEGDVIAAPQQVFLTNDQNTVIGTCKTETEGEFFFGGKSKNIVLGGSKYEFFTDSSSGKNQGAQVLPGGDIVSPKIQNHASGNVFSEVFAEMNASAETQESTGIPNTVKTFKSDGSFFTQEPAMAVEVPEVETTGNLKSALPLQSGNIFDPSAAIDAEDIAAGKTTADSEANIEVKSAQFAGNKNEDLSFLKSSVPQTNTEPVIKTGTGANKQAEFTAANSENNLSENPIEINAGPDNETGEGMANKETEAVKNQNINISGEKDGVKNNSNAATESKSTDKILHEPEKSKENSNSVKENAVRLYPEYVSEDETEPETGSPFNFSPRFRNEFIKHNSINTDGQVKSDSGIYEISIEKTKPEVAGFNEKILPQDFDTSDYETLSSGIFTKNGDSFKEFKPVEKTDAPVEKNISKLNEEVKNNSASEEQASNTGSNHNSGNENNHKPANKTANEVVFSDHLQHRSAGVNETAAFRPVKGYTSVFKEIDASNLVDEIKNLCVKGEKSNITLKLTPEHLGAVKLSIDIKDSVMSTSIEVENESVRQVVQNNIDTLRQTLQANGIQLSSFSVSLSNQHEQKSSGKSGNKKEKQQENEGIKLKTEEKTVKTKKLGYNTYEYLA